MPNRDLIIQQEILLDGLKADDVRGLEKRVLVPHVKQVPEDLLMENKAKVLSLDAGRQFYLQQDSTII